MSTVFSPYKVGDPIQWKWVGGIVEGKIEEVFMGPIEKIIKGKKIKRNGTVEKPAYLVRSEAGNIALKLHTELVKK
jgi:hypothetical protein